MKKQMILTALLAMSAITSFTQDGDTGATPPPAGGPGHPGRRPMPAIVAALDENKDGVIDANELANATALLTKLDKNGDGKLTPDEFMGAGPRGEGHGPGGHGGKGPRGQRPAPPQE